MNKHIAEAKNICARLGQHVKENGIRQATIAEKSGLSQSTISQVLNGRHNVTLSVFLAIAEACDLTPAEAISLEPAPTVTIAGHTYKLTKKA